MEFTTFTFIVFLGILGIALLSYVVFILMDSISNDILESMVLLVLFIITAFVLAGIFYHPGILTGKTQPVEAVEK